MTPTIQQKRDAYKKLSDEVKNIILDNETTESIQNMLSNYSLNEDQSDSSDSQILYAMYGLQTLDDAITSISKITNKSISELSTLKMGLERSIFSKILSPQSDGKKIDLVFAKKRVAEIVNKYGLSSSQATVLENEVMSVIERNKNEKITALDLVNLLNISNLLSEQIVFELESRVFERGVKIAEKPEPSKYVVAETKQTPIQAPTENLSGTLNIPKEMMKPSLQNDALDKQKPSDGTSIGVPRYATEEIYKTETPVTNTMPAAANIVANKLNNVTSTIRPIETQYQKDPYREPLE